MKWTSHKGTGEKKPLSLIGMIVLITLIGAVVRCFYVFSASFPLNDGGMFYVMVRDLQANAFRLPLYTSYNGGNIPYAYPPLPFYLAAGLNQWLGIGLISLLRFLPLLFSIATIPVFAWLAQEVLAEKHPVALATLVLPCFLRPMNGRSWGAADPCPGSVVHPGRAGFSGTLVPQT